MAAKNLKGQKFGRLTVLERAIANKKRVKWLCKCECGNETEVATCDLKNGHTKSCGCLRSEMVKYINKTHGQSINNTNYRSYRSMINRCYNKNSKYYHEWGGRGIKVCNRWLGRKGYDNFLKDMGGKPSLLYSLDRYPNNDGNYEPSNCRWATDEQQSKNKRNNVYIEFKGKRMLLSEWAKLLKVNASNLKRMASKKSMAETISYYLQRNYYKDKRNNFFVMKIN